MIVRDLRKSLSDKYLRRVTIWSLEMTIWSLRKSLSDKDLRQK